MPQMSPVPIQPPEGIGGPIRRLVDQLPRPFLGTRETVNELSKFEHIELAIETPSNRVYGWALAAASRNVKAVQYGLRAGTCDVDISYGAFGSETAISWDGAAGTTISVTTLEMKKELKMCMPSMGTDSHMLK